MEIYTVSFVKFSDLVDGLSEETQNAISSNIGDSVTWGDALHTLISVRKVCSNLDISDDDEPEFVTFKKRLYSLPPTACIDMEN